MRPSRLAHGAFSVPPGGWGLDMRSRLAKTARMALSRSLQRPHWWLALLLLAGLGVQGLWIAQDRERLVSQLLSEDAHYYFQTARSVAEGRGSVSSGGVAHNGYHPLWMLVCAAAFRVFAEPGGDPMVAIRAILLLAAALGALSAGLVWALLRRLGAGAAAAWLGAAVFYLNPKLLPLMVSGLEVPLQAALLAGTLLWMLRDGGRRAGPRWYAVLGILLGLCYLTRTDNVFFGAFVWLAVAWRRRGRPGHGRGMALATALGLALVLPWQLWNYLHFGSLMQGSAGALPYVRRLVWFEAHPGAAASDFTRYRWQLFFGYFPALFWHAGLGALSYALALVVTALACTARGRRHFYPLLLALGRLGPLLAAVLALGFAHKFLRLATREWYFVPSDLAVALAWGLAVEFLWRTAPGRRWRLGGFALLLALLALWFGRKALVEWAPRERSYALEIRDAFEALEDYRPGERLGATDSGIVGFWCERPVVNLDGVVNNEAARHIRQGNLIDYLDARGIRYLTITPRMQTPAIWGPEYGSRLVRFPALTAEGFRLLPPAQARPVGPRDLPQGQQPAAIDQQKDRPQPQQGP